MFLAVLFMPVMSDAAEMPSFYDGADIVKGEAAAEVKNALEAVEKKHNVRIAVVTQPSVEGMKIGDYADKLLGTVIKGGEKGNMVLILDMQERDWYIATDPKMKAMITNDIGIKLMKDAFVSKLSAGNYAEAFTPGATLLIVPIRSFLTPKAPSRERTAAIPNPRKLN